jgi:hypothetical protein
MMTPEEMCWRDATLAPPFDRWPRWAVEVNAEITDLIGDITGAVDDYEDDAVVMAQCAALDALRAKLARLVEEWTG